MPKRQRQATRVTPGFSAPFKGNPQQGTLFDKRTLLNPDQHIGPRGYSPERIRAVRATGIGDKLRVNYESVREARENIVGLGRSAGLRSRDARPGAAETNEAAQGYSDLHDTIPEVGPDISNYGPAYLGMKHNDPMTEPRVDTQRKQMMRGRNRLVEDLARSTVPTEHLEGISAISIRNQHRVGSGIAGLYNPVAQHMTIVPQRGAPDEWSREAEPQRGPRDPDENFTLLHELGHHVSNQMGNEHSGMGYRTISGKGKEETFADTYALKHYREDTRGRNWEQVGSWDPRNATYKGKGIDTYTKFQGAYRLRPEDEPIREPTTVTPEREETLRPLLPGMPTEGRPGDPSIFHELRRRANGSRLRPVREMQQAYIQSRWDPRRR